MSQKEKVIIKLREDGEVSRNWALREHSIYRLGSIIYILKKEDGWEIEGKPNGGDYVYKLIEVGKIPKKVRIEEIPSEYISSGIVNMK